MPKINTEAKYQQPTLAQVRFYKAAEYLKSNGIDIQSRSDDHYRQAIIIASGIKPENKEEK